LTEIKNMARGRPRSPANSPDSYSSDAYDKFLSRIDDNSSELAEVQADRREILKAEAQRGLNRKAHAFVQALRTAVRNDKLTQQDAVATLDCVTVYAEWSGVTKQSDLFRNASQTDAVTAANEKATKAASAPALNGSNGGSKPKRQKKGPSLDTGAALDAAREHLGTTTT
jgi:hypothetical protein